MKSNFTESPRTFKVGETTLKDYGKILLESDEMISFQTPEGLEYDFTAKEWGFYASPSINGRLVHEGFKTALVMNEHNSIYIMTVAKEKLDLFKAYLKEKQDNRIICWLDEFFNEEKNFKE